MSTADNTGGSRHFADWPARKPVLPNTSAAATGQQSRWSTACEQYLDGSQAGKIAPHSWQDRLSSVPIVTAPHSEAVTDTAKRAAGIVHVALPARKTENQAAGPAPRHEIAVAGLAADAWLSTPGLGVLCAYCPASWHHPVGIQKVLRRITPFLPDVSGALFVTLTFDRNQFSGPGSAHDLGRPHIRKVLHALRRGVEHEGKTYQIDAPYCVKVEFHEDDWAHYHLIILTRRYIPGELLNELWGFGRCNVQRINNSHFHYLLKYVTKGGEYPEWVRSRRRLRIFQPSHGFMKAREAAPPVEAVKRLSPERKRASYTIGERLHRWSRMALYNKHGQFRTVTLYRPFQELFDQLVLSIAEVKRYLGNGFIKIDETKDILPWILNPQT